MGLPQAGKTLFIRGEREREGEGARGMDGHYHSIETVQEEEPVWRREGTCGKQRLVTGNISASDFNVGAM